MGPKRHGPDWTGDDDEDEDYGSRPSPRKKQKTTAAARGSRPKPRRRAGYSGSDIEDDDDDISEEEDDLDIESEEDDEEPVEYASGRRGRKAAATRAKYEEPDSDEFDEDEEEEEEVKPQRRKLKTRGIVASDDEEVHAAQPRDPEEKERLIVKLKLPAMGASSSAIRATRSRTSSKTVVKPESSYGLRRDSRTIHNDIVFDERPERGRSYSGDHPRRDTRASKRLATTSPIAERVPPAIPEEQEAEHDILTTDLPMAEDPDAEAEADDSGFGPDAQAARNVVLDSVADDDDDEAPPTRRTRSFKAPLKTIPAASGRQTRSSRRGGRNEEEATSDFNPEEAEEAPEDEEMSASDASPNKESQSGDISSQQGRRSGRLAKKRASRRASMEDSELDVEELAEEAADLAASRVRNTRRRGRIASIAYDQPKLRERAERKDYRIYRPELAFADDDEGPAITTAGPRSKKSAGAYRSLFSTQGPFGGTGGPTPLFGNAAAGGADSDSSDDDGNRAAKTNIGGTVGMTPTTAVAQNMFGQTLNNDPLQAGSGLGKIKDKKALADADPLGVDQNVTFDGVGGMEDHISSLKEMVLLPLLYPDLFQTLHITPPRGVLFHGPPGTGKTLLARALATSVSTQGQKVTFYMRKGADALSKWVGEAERQLRLLFEEARKNQPSIIFFDEIDGLAPVRSSKQEQIHASIVATLLALMDGMDGRGQVIVIGATNRPDSVDPALRRPGRFDREFYFPLPSEKARRSIIDIHTKGWEPPLEPKFKDQLATLTKGYGGADLRALCTEAALNAIQGTYPQIYQSNERLLVDPKQIKVLAKDFMISVNKMIPSSERSAPSGAAPLESNVEPLLREALAKITNLLDDVLPERKKLTALEEAEYGDREDGAGFEKEIMQQTFDKARVFRPRLLVYGAQGMGQSYIGKAILHKFERLHVQSLDLSVLYSDTARSPEAAVVQLFNEARRHKPSVIYIPNTDIWYQTVGDSVIRLLTGLLRTLPPNEAVLLLGIMELEPGVEDPRPDPKLIKDLFGFSQQSHVRLDRPSEPQRNEYFGTICSWIAMRPVDFPDLDNRKKRQLPELEKAPLPPAPKKELTKEEKKIQRKNDRHTLNLLKMRIQPIIDQLKRSYKLFFRPPVDPDLFQYLYDEQDPAFLGTDMSEEQRMAQEDRPFELAKDKKGVPGIIQKSTGNFYYNLELLTIERRLVNGYYKRPRDFGADIKRLYKDAVTLGDPNRIQKSDQMRTNVETDLIYIEKSEPALLAELEKVSEREQERLKELEEQMNLEAAQKRDVPIIIPNIPPQVSTTTENTGPIVLGQIPGREPVPVPRTALERFTSSHLSNGMSSSEGHHNEDSLDQHGDVDMTGTTGTDPYRIEPSEVQHMDISDGQTGRHPEDAEPHTQVESQSQHILTQSSAITPMQPGSVPTDYHNSASTTTSGKKSSDKSHSTNGSGASRLDHPNLSNVRSLMNSDDSQMPSTQEMNFNSSPSEYSQRSNAGTGLGDTVSASTNAAGSMAPPPPRNSLSIDALINPSEPAPRMPMLIPVDRNVMEHLREELKHRTSGFSVEQLEQTNAALVDAVWKTRGDWNRNHVAEAVSNAFNRVVLEIEAMQKIARHSQEDDHVQYRDVSFDGSFGRRS